MGDSLSRVYALVDAVGRIVRIEGEYTLPEDLTGWVLVEEGVSCDKRNLAQRLYLPGGSMTEDGVCRWKLVDGQPVLRSDGEMDADRAAMPARLPAQLDQLEAQVTYTAMMTDTLPEE